jgi:hypothetical protein
MPTCVRAADAKHDAAAREDPSLALHAHDSSIAIVYRQVVAETRRHWAQNASTHANERGHHLELA